MWAQIKASGVMIPLDPQPTHGTETNRGYSRHYCPKKEE